MLDSEKLCEISKFKIFLVRIYNFIARCESVNCTYVDVI
jgi:hypothetical protein